MRIGRIVLAISILAASGSLGFAWAQQNQTNQPPRRVNPNDPINRPPPPPPDRRYVTPTPGPSQPMERINPVPPLSQPPTR